MSPWFSFEGSEHDLTPEVRVRGEGPIESLATSELSENLRHRDS